MDNLICSYLLSFFSIVQCTCSQTLKILLWMMGLKESHQAILTLLWFCSVLNHVLAYKYIDGAPSSFEVGLVLRHLQPWIDLWVGIVWIAPAVHLMVPLHLPKARPAPMLSSIWCKATHILPFLSRYKMWPQCPLFLPFKCSRVVAFCIGGL